MKQAPKTTIRTMQDDTLNARVTLLSTGLRFCEQGDTFDAEGDGFRAQSDAFGAKVTLSALFALDCVNVSTSPGKQAA
jgi:hypothetical protein